MNNLVEIVVACLHLLEYVAKIGSVVLLYVNILNTDLFAEYLERDAEGYINVEGHSPCTNVAGVFASGDCADPHYRQAIVAAASGCKAAMEAEKYLASLG